MKRAWISIGLMVPLGFVACASGPGGAEPEADGPHAETAQQVGAGAVDQGDAFRFVGHMSTENRGCTAILVSPLWMLTARHCIVGAWKGPGLTVDGVLNGTNCEVKPPVSDEWSSFAVDFAVVPTNEKVWLDSTCTPSPPSPALGAATGVWSDPNCPTHTLSVAGPGVGMVSPTPYTGPYTTSTPGQPIDLCTDEGNATDLALFQLDDRIPTSARQPKPLPLVPGVPTCGDGEDGILVGYGKTSLTQAGPDGGARTVSYSSDWGRETVGDAALYTNYWVWGVETYRGSLSGDSGGPLLSQDSQALCAVVSSHAQEPEFVDCAFGLPCPTYPVPVTRSDLAAVDSPAALAFFRANHVIDDYGELMGQCTTGTAALRDVDTDRDQIPDACDPCPSVPDVGYRTTGRYAPQFDLRLDRDGDGINENDKNGDGKPDNDADGDGIPDVCDNCPATPNAPAAGLGYPQSDVDADQLGDACDPCSKVGVAELLCCSSDQDCIKADAGTRCFATTSAACGGLGRCGSARDRDGDAVPDACDSCPATPGAQKDTDGDGIGDICDRCSGANASHVGVPTTPATLTVDQSKDDCNPNSSVADAACVIATGNAQSVCVVVTGAPKGGRCSEGRDTDGDKIGDACDGCASEADPTQANCNRDIEIAQNVPYPLPGDRCDRTPCALVTNGSIALYATDPPGDMMANVGLTPQLLPKGVPGAYSYGALKVPTADVGSRFCPCTSTDAQLCASDPAAGCALNGGLYGQALSPTQQWRTPTVHAVGSGSAPPSPATPGVVDALLGGLSITSANPTYTSPFPGGTQWLQWNVTQESTFGVLPGPTSTPTMLCSDGLGVKGIYWAAVRDVAFLNAAPASYWPLSNHYEGGIWGLKPTCATFFQPQLVPPGAGLGGGILPLTNCLFCEVECPQCAPKGIPDLSILFKPGDASPELVAYEGGRNGLPIGGQGLDLAGLLASPGLSFVSASDVWHTASPGAQLAAVGQDGHAVLTARYTEGALTVTRGGREPTRATAPAAMTAQADSVAFALSSGEDTLFVARGRATGGGTLHLTALAEDMTIPLALHGGELHAPVAMTYRAADRSLYVVDERRWGPLTWARLVRIQLATGVLEVLGVWPRLGGFDRTLLSVGEDAQLVLSASSRKGKGKHAVLALDVQPDGALHVAFGLAGKGALTLPAVLTHTGLTLPIADLANTQGRFVPTDALPHSHGPGLAGCF